MGCAFGVTASRAVYTNHPVGLGQGCRQAIGEILQIASQAVNQHNGGTLSLIDVMQTRIAQLNKSTSRGQKIFRFFV